MCSFHITHTIILFLLLLVSQFPLNISTVGYFIGTDTSGTLTASEVCNNADGRLAIINSYTDFTEASSTASSSGYYWVVVALHCTSRDTSCGDSASKWTWFDSQNYNNDLCDISVGGMDDISLYQTWDQWDKTPDENEYCVEFYGGKLVLEYCSNVNGIIIDSDTENPNAALCQPLSASITTCTGVEYFIGTDNTGILTASEVCNNAGGRLAIIDDSTTKFTEASTVATESGYYWVVVGLHCTSRDTSCGNSASKWTWFDSQNYNEDLCDISAGGMDDISLYQAWDQWDKTPDDNEYCVEFYGGKLVLEYCSNVNGIIIDSDTENPNAALCQPLSYSISSCEDYIATVTSTDAEINISISNVLIAVGVAIFLVGIGVGIYRCYRNNRADDDTQASYSAINTECIPGTDTTVHTGVHTGVHVSVPPVPRVETDVNMNRSDVGLKGSLPNGWRVVYTADGKRYYQNDITKETRWEMPSETVHPVVDVNPAVVVQSVKNWMGNTVRFPQYVDCFVSNGYDSLEVIMDITDKSDLEDIGITMKGHQNRIMKQIEMLRNGRCDTQVTPNIATGAPSAPTQEVIDIDIATEGASTGTGGRAEGYY